MKKIKETKIKKLENGIISVNGKYYYAKFKEIDKYNERRFDFQKFNLNKYLKDLKKEKVNIKDYIDEYKLTVIEDSTYDIKRVEIIKDP